MESCSKLVYLKFARNTGMFQKLKCLGSIQWFVSLKDLTRTINLSQHHRKKLNDQKMFGKYLREPEK